MDYNIEIENAMSEEYIIWYKSMETYIRNNRLRDCELRKITGKILNYCPSNNVSVLSKEGIYDISYNLIVCLEPIISIK